MKEGRLRQDLYYRLNVPRIHIPPLRNQPTNIPLLLPHFLEEMYRRYHRGVEGFSPETWPSS